jgi:hypothetical protein
MREPAGIRFVARNLREMEEQERRRWKAEFEQLGLEQVRGLLMSGRLRPDKLAYARQWVERRDVQAFQDRRRDGGPSNVGLAGLRSYKRIWVVVAGVMFGAFALFRIVSRLHF